MPIYEYRCHSCEQVFEVFQKMSDPPPATHQCGGTKITRLLSNTSFRLVGTGWYATDYAKKPAPEQSGAENKKERKATAEGGKSEGSSSPKKGPADAKGSS